MSHADDRATIRANRKIDSMNTGQVLWYLVWRNKLYLSLFANGMFLTVFIVRFMGN